MTEPQDLFGAEQRDTEADTFPSDDETRALFGFPVATMKPLTREQFRSDEAYRDAVEAHRVRHPELYG